MGHEKGPKPQVETPDTIHYTPYTIHYTPPSTLNPRPSTLNPQPSTLNPQPSTLNPQPSTLNPQPWILLTGPLVGINLVCKPKDTENHLYIPNPKPTALNLESLTPNPLQVGMNVLLRPGAERVRVERYGDHGAGGTPGILSVIYEEEGVRMFPRNAGDIF